MRGSAPGDAVAGVGYRTARRVGAGLWDGPGTTRLSTPSETDSMRLGGFSRPAPYLMGSGIPVRTRAGRDLEGHGKLNRRIHLALDNAANLIELPRCNLHYQLIVHLKQNA